MKAVVGKLVFGTPSALARESFINDNNSRVHRWKQMSPRGMGTRYVIVTSTALD